MLAHKQRLIAAIEAMKIGNAGKLPLKVKSFDGELLPQILKQESLNSPVALVTLQNAKVNKDHDVVAEWVIFVVSSQQGNLTSNDSCLLLASQLANQLQDADIGQVQQEPDGNAIRNVFNQQYSQMKIAVYAVEFSCVYEEYITPEVDDTALAQINITAQDAQKSTLIQSEVKL